jgi:hypothetical protein
MIPANDWQAIYAWGDEGDAEKGDVCAHASPLVAFVLAKVTVARIYEDGTEEVTDYFPAIVGTMLALLALCLPRRLPTLWPICPLASRSIPS